MDNPKIRDVLKELGLSPARSRGQNFLKDDWLIQCLIKKIGHAAGSLTTNFLEIGPGLGALTRPLLVAGAKIIAVELDRGLAKNLNRLIYEYPGQLTILNRNILTVDPAELNITQVRLESETPFFLFGNLPYNISSPSLFWFLRHRRYFSGAVFMLQQELAHRLSAPPGNRNYGRLTVALSLWSRVNQVMTVPPSAFYPQPKVKSVVVRLTPTPPTEEPPITIEALGRFTLVAFGARRQTILNNLARTYSRKRATQALAELNLNPAARAETLPPTTLVALALTLSNFSNP
ncbi:MAG: hypothetical protein AMR96_05695 [Candidatus Adiutrix intracellularis]|jgi:16S rRNA (adenine1518-N6/adenine1519-N6)-dimethyltransferase|nr:MAG: hypothetical protein AMR96_05695 [Candidatus Adiutrix intracellularis]MDR2826990.1 16S rRNA (adenine(1518)-N(6)/adenine(1519)-N(6))-dimethyltransferase RsmA [Candidatus Adiutrix intracellularis]